MVKIFTGFLVSLLVTVIATGLIVYVHGGLELRGTTPEPIFYTAAMYLAVGAASGALMRSSGLRGAVSAAVGFLLAVLALRAVPLILDLLESNFQTPFDSLLLGNRVYFWPASFLIMYLAMTFAGRKSSKSLDDAEIPVYEMRDRIAKAGLFVEPTEVAAMRSGAKGAICKICYADRRDGSGDWMYEYVRCPHNPAHVFHAHHFFKKKWRCPVDAHPLLSTE